jgi:hypothetical protein
MSTANKKTSIYDYVIVGGGLSGLCVASALTKEGAQVLLLEAAESYGGVNHPVQTKIGVSENGLRFLPDTELAHRSLEFLSSLSGQEVKFRSVEREPLTYEAGGLRSFVGFGEQSPEFYDEISYFLSPKELVLEEPFHVWTKTLFESFRGEFAPRSHVTKFHASEGKVHSITINGQKTIQALNIIYAGPLKSLGLLLPDEALPARARQKFSKAKFWTAVGLDLIHSAPVTDFAGIHVLNGTTQDDLGPCVGRFQPSATLNESPVQLSQWLSFIDDEDAEDTEKIGAALKKIKRQIKRAYPAALDQLVSERILVVPSIAGNGELKLTGHQTLPQANNFWVASGNVHPLKNILGTLAQAQLVTSSLGVNPLGASVNEVSDSREEEIEA